MSDLNAERKSINEIFSNNKARFLIPDYQRPYSWTIEHCETLWEDLKEFSFPADDDFDEDSDEYFLGTTVTFNNKEYKCQEVIDGQQRLITLLLLLRAFYESFGESESGPRKKLSECIWRTKNYQTDFSSCKINYEVIDDESGDEFKKIIAEGVAPREFKSNYAENYRYFQKRIDEFKLKTPDNFSLFTTRILHNCILLPIETNSQSTAFRIFTTLNDRGMPLSDADIFKAQFYKFYKQKDNKSEKENFIKRWKELERLCNKNFHPRKGTPCDDLFMRYMYYAKTKRAVGKKERISDTFSNMRDFYSEDNYKLLCDEETFDDLMALVNFWDEVANRNEIFSPKVLKKLYILSYSPYTLWAYIVSLYFMSNRKLDEEKFCNFLDKVTAMILMNAVLDLGKSNIRRPFVMAFKDIFNGKPLEFDIQFKPQAEILRRRLAEMKFSNSKLITRAMMAWWTFKDDAQELPPLDTRLEVEHIYAVRRNDFSPLADERSLELLGNKSLLEKRINIRASDYRFEDKKKYYLGYTKGRQKVQGTMIRELREIAETKKDFTEEDILTRNEKILSAFMKYLAQNNLLR
ncbi:MAG: DUF262 domain-containing protein [Selenomonadaceae bacterium]|nr:DUF262 domain-containing protein [Selenomonadaceae bacterium]MBQ7630022.1 DUF262 domain-containing protein [Selenomonadaceae bacterium]